MAYRSSLRTFATARPLRGEANIGVCPGQGNISPHLFKLIQHEISTSPGDIIDVIEKVRPIIKDPRMFAFFDPKRSPFMTKDHPSMDLLKSTSFVQPLLLLTTYLNYQLVKKYSNWDIQHSDYLLGHSLGELSSFVLQDVLSLDSGLKISTIRGQLMEEAISQNGDDDKWGMCALIFNPFDYKTLITLCETNLNLNIATINGLNQIVVSGKRKELEDKLNKLDGLRKYLINMKRWKGGLKKVWLKTEIPVHHPIFKSIEPQLREVIFQEHEKCGKNDLKVPIVSNIDGSIIAKSSERALNNFINLTSSTVKFTDCLKTIEELRTIDPTLDLNFVNVSDVTSGLVSRYFKDVKIEANNYDLISETLDKLTADN